MTGREHENAVRAAKQRALADLRQWLGSGADARDVSGDPLPPGEWDGTVNGTRM